MISSSIIISTVTALLVLHVSCKHTKNCLEEHQHYEQIKLKGKGTAFYWFFESYQDDGEHEPILNNRPIMVVNGHEGVSATGYHNIMAMGPKDIHGRVRSTYLKNYHLLFIDTPLGTGFSRVHGRNNYSKNSTEVAEAMVDVFVYFIKKFNHLCGSKVWMYSESYGSKYTVEFAYLLTQAKENNKCNIDLAGVFLVSPILDLPKQMENWATYLHALGYIDSSRGNKINNKVKEINYSVRKGNYEEASNLYQELEESLSERQFSGELGINAINFCNVQDCFIDRRCAHTRDPIPYITQRKERNVHNSRKLKKSKAGKSNYLLRKAYEFISGAQDEGLVHYMNDVIKKNLSCAISSDTYFGKDDQILINSLKNELLKSSTNFVAELLKQDLQVAIVSGQFDLYANRIATEKWIENLKWSEINKWKLARVQPLTMDDEYIGDCSESKCYKIGNIKQYNNLIFINLFNGSHFIYRSNPNSMRTIIDLVSNRKKYRKPSVTTHLYDIQTVSTSRYDTTYVKPTNAPTTSVTIKSTPKTTTTTTTFAPVVINITKYETQSITPSTLMSNSSASYKIISKSLKRKPDPPVKKLGPSKSDLFFKKHSP